MFVWVCWYECYWCDWWLVVYCFGVILVLVWCNLVVCDGEVQDGRLLLCMKELSFEVCEWVQVYLFMYIVSIEFSLFVVVFGGLLVSLELCYVGCLWCCGIFCKVCSGSGFELLWEVLQGGDWVLLEQFMLLDFWSLCFCCDDRGWIVSLEYLGVCEVVNCFFVYCCYIFLVVEQCLVLLGVFV